MGIFDQSGYRVRLQWGRRGAQAGAERGDVLVVVDVLRFSTTVTEAVRRGATIYPCPWNFNPRRTAELLEHVVQMEIAVHDNDAPAKGRYTLSPLTYRDIKAGIAVILPSANGATCAHLGAKVPVLFVGALINAMATGKAVQLEAERLDAGLSVIVCGERWTDEPSKDVLRFAIEDYLGAGAIVSQISLPKSPEAQVCETAFLGCRERLEEVIWDCASGRELRARGLEEDVRFAARVNVTDVVAVMRGGRFERYSTHCDAG
jgi:2-phosphosulfolactate phosphatase